MQGSDALHQFTANALVEFLALEIGKLDGIVAPGGPANDGNLGGVEHFAATGEPFVCAEKTDRNHRYSGLGDDEADAGLSG